SLGRDRQQIGPAGDAMMHAGRGKKMSKIVELEIQRVLERSVGARFLPEQNPGLEATVRALRQPENPDGFLNPTLHSRVARASERGGGGFEPFVEISIVEGGSAAAAL